MKPRRLAGFAGEAATAESAGTIASRSGSASDTPIPRRNVRRGNASFSMYMASAPRASFLLLCGRRLRPPGPIVRHSCRRVRLPHLKRRALRDADDESLHRVVRSFGIADDPPDRRRIVVLQTASERVGHELL